MDTTTIVNVEERPTNTLGRSMWRITDAEGVRYATHNVWLASLAKQYMTTGALVRMHSASGWFYRSLTSIVPSEQVGVA